MRALLDLLVPSCCDGCGRPSPPPWCAVCDAAFVDAAPVDPCRWCGSAVGVGHPCWVGAPPVDELIVLGPWTAGVARAVTRAKLAGRREVLLAAGALVGEVVATRDTGVEAIVALPTDRRRARSRGRDHTRELVRGVARVLDRPVLRPFAPVTGSADRVGVGGRDLAPTVPTFVVADPTASIGRRLLLVDDVVTTGTTLAAAATTLCQAGAVVVGAVIGRAGGHELRPPGAAVSR